MINKICKKCHIQKDITLFAKRHNSKDGAAYWCKACYKELHALKYLENKQQYLDKKDVLNIKRRENRTLRIEMFRQKEQQYRENNKERIYKRSKQWRENNKEHVKIWRKENYTKNRTLFSKNGKLKRQNPLYRLSSNIRTRLWHALKNKHYKKSTTNTLLTSLGCSIQELKKHLESQFELNMSWDNYGKEWHIDHVKPLSLATNEQEKYDLNHFSNLQPLWAQDNIRKGAKDGIKNQI